MHTIDELSAATATASSGSGFADGVRAMVPMAVGVVPLGLAIGAASSGLGADPLTTWFGSWLLLAGSAQLTIMQLLHDGAAPAVIVAVALLINARFAVYSAGLAAWFPTASRRTRMLLAVPLVDPLYLTATSAYERQPLSEDRRRSFYLGAAGNLAATWVVAQTIGLLIGDRLPDGLGLHAASMLACVGLLASSLNDRSAAIAAVAAGVTTVVGFDLPHHTVILVAIAAGLTFGAPRRTP